MRGCGFCRPLSWRHHGRRMEGESGAYKLGVAARIEARRDTALAYAPSLQGADWIPLSADPSADTAPLHLAAKTELARSWCTAGCGRSNALPRYRLDQVNLEGEGV